MLTYGYNREEIVHSVVNRMYDARYATYMLLGTKEPEVAAFPSIAFLSHIFRLTIAIGLPVRTAEAQPRKPRRLRRHQWVQFQESQKIQKPQSKSAEQIHNHTHQVKNRR